MVAQPEHSRGTHRMGHVVILLHSVLRRDEGAGFFSRLAALESAIAAIRRMGGLHWIHHHYACCRFFRFPQGQLEHVGLCGIVYWHSDLHCADLGLEAVAPNEGESRILNRPSPSVRACPN